MEEQVIKHIQVGTKYKVTFEQAAVKGQLGWKVEVNGDDSQVVMLEGIKMKMQATNVAPPIQVEGEE